MATDKPLDRLRPFRRINNDDFLLNDPPDGDGIACGCHTPDDFPNLEEEFKKFLRDPQNTGALGNLLEVLEEARRVARTVAQVAQTALTVANAALLALGAVAGGPILGFLLIIQEAIAAARAITQFIDNVINLIDAAVIEFFARIGAKLARRAIRRIPQWVPVVKGASNERITRDQIKEVEGIVTRSYGDPIGTPFFQWQHWLNWSFQVRPEPLYEKLLVPNFSFNTDGRKAGETPIISTGTFEVQWDAGALLADDDGAGPYEAGFEDVQMPAMDGPMVSGGGRPSDWIWPTTGMFAWASGRLVYDCSRTDTTAEGAKPKMVSMMNPPRAMATAWWEARQFPENFAAGGTQETSSRVPAIRFMFLASKHGGYMDYDAAGEEDYEFILDLPPAEVPVAPFPIGHTFAHKRELGEAPDFPHNTIVVRPRLLRELVTPLGGPAAAGKLKPIIEIIPPPQDKPGAVPQQVKLTIKGADIAAVKHGMAGFILSLGWHDPNGTQAQTVKDCTVAFSAIQGRLNVTRDSPLRQIREPFEAELNAVKDRLKREIDNMEIPLPVPGAPSVTINDLINNNLPRPFPGDLVASIGREIQSALHKAIDAAFDTIFNNLADLVDSTQTEEWLVRFGVNGRWETRYFDNVDKGVMVIPNPPTFEIPLGPDDLLFYSTSGVEFNPVGDMMRAPRNNRLLRDGKGRPFTWNEIVNATGATRRNLIFDYTLKILAGTSKTGLLALGIENEPLGIRDPGSFAQAGSDLATSNPLAMKQAPLGTSQISPVARFARAAGNGQEFVLVEDSGKSDYRITGLVQVRKQKTAGGS